MLFAGLAATALVVLAGSLGLLDRIEWRTQDFRYRYARQSVDALGDRVRLVAIDDRALDTIGRWPWPRQTFARALDEIALAGARAVAIDVLFTDPESAAADAALGAAVARAPTVVAVNMDEGRLDARTWGTPAGREALDAIVRVACADITAPAESIADRAGLAGERRQRFLERSSTFKKYAAWKQLLDLRDAGRLPADERAWILSMTAGDATLERFPERVLLEEAYRRDRAFGALSRFMGTARGNGAPLDAPPVAAVAEGAAGAGFVNSRPDADGEYRRARPFWDMPYGALPQFGMAGALLAMGVPATEVRVDDGALAFPDGRRLPLEQGQFFVDWPTDIFETTVDEERARERNVDGGVMAIGVLIDLAAQRDVLRAQEERYRALGSDLAAAQGGISPEELAQVPVSESVRARIKDQGEFVAGDLEVRGTDDVKDLPEDQRRLVGAYREWWRLDREVVRSRASIDAAAAEVRRRLEGRLVFVGWIATGVMADMINTVYGPRTPGVFFHAAVADMVLTNEHVVLWPAWTGIVAAAVLGVLCAHVAWRTGAGLSTTVTVACVAGWILVAGAWAFAAFDLVIPIAVPVVAALASQAASVSTAAVVNQREKARITRQFRARVSPQLVELLASDPKALSMRGQQRSSTILFGDLAGFTTISEKLGSEAVVATLNLYMSAMAHELTERRAYVNKFLGDGLLAFWSAFGEEPEQGQLAVEACRACQRVVNEITARPDRQGLPPISLRLGVATGVVTIGDCGAPPDLNDYTVIGDSANLAARLESANKQFGTAILFDGNTRALVRDSGGLPIVSLGRVVVVGQSVPIDLYTMLVEDPPDGWVEGVGRAVDAFARADFAGCEAAWQAFEARFGATKIAKPFREAMEDAEDLRDGVLRLHAK